MLMLELDVECQFVPCYRRIQHADIGKVERWNLPLEMNCSTTYIVQKIEAVILK